MTNTRLRKIKRADRINTILLLVACVIALTLVCISMVKEKANYNNGICSKCSHYYETTIVKDINNGDTIVYECPNCGNHGSVDASLIK